MMTPKIYFLILFLFLLSSKAIGQNEKIELNLQIVKDTTLANTKIPVLIYMKEQVDLKLLENQMKIQYGNNLTPKIRYQVVITALQDISTVTQV